MGKSKTNAKLLERNFDILGYFYNPLKRVFLTNKPERVIDKSVSFMAFHTSVIVVGGGADNCLIELLNQNKCDDITHVDISSVMSANARKRVLKSNSVKVNSVDFIVKPFLEFLGSKSFEGILFPFYLDLFLDEEVTDNIKHAKSMLAVNGVVYVIDFSPPQKLNSLNKIKVSLLYKLFYPFTSVNRNSVPEYDVLFTKNGFKKTEEHVFFGGLYSLKVFKLVN